MYCSDCLHIDATDAAAWHRLGCVLGEARLFDASAECMHTAQRLNERAPLVPFTVIPRCLP